HPRLFQLLVAERRTAGQQFVQEDAQRVDITPGVDVELVDLGLLGRHVIQGADDVAEPGNQGLVGQRVPGRLGHAKVDDLRHWGAVVDGDQNIRGLKVAVDDA